jgi:hypothetical protein
VTSKKKTAKKKVAKKSKRPGRPKGKVFKKKVAKKGWPKGKKRGKRPGRPKGSKNKKKAGRPRKKTRSVKVSNTITLPVDNKHDLKFWSDMVIFLNKNAGKSFCIQMDGVKYSLNTL